MSARKRQSEPVEPSLAQRVSETVAALRLGPADSGTVGLALLLAATIDGMDEATRARMLAQTSGQLLAVLGVLRSRSVPLPQGVSKLDELRERHAARMRRVGDHSFVGSRQVGA